jgi:hypothetical protein
VYGKMAYATNLQFAERSGLGIRVVDENVGTGDNSTTSFDLDNDNIISGSYTLQHAPSDSNSMVALTETTHYTLDKESGRIVLTADGVTALGTDILYATYWYIENFSDSVITDLLSVADDEVDKLTGRSWGTSTSITEYHNGRKTSEYPTTDRPYDTDWDQPDFIMLKKWPVTKVDNVLLLSEPVSVSKFFNYDSGTGSYTYYSLRLYSQYMNQYLNHN